MDTKKQTDQSQAFIEDFEERAAIMEYEAGLSREDAEDLARQVIAERGDHETLE